MLAQSKSERIDIRAPKSAKLLLQQAAAARSKSVSEFVLDAALREADNVLAAPPRLSLSPEQWALFLDALDQPARRRPGLEKLLASKSALE